MFLNRDNRALYPHQREILGELFKGKRYIVAAPRTGKTRPAIEFLRSVENVLVLTKKAAVPGWLSEMEAMGVDGWAVVNYERVRTKGWDMSKEWGALVLDECHSGCATYPKPNKVTPLIHQLLVSGPRIALSATPCPETYSQLFHQAKALKLPIWAEFKNFYAWHRVYGVPKSIRAHGRMVPVYTEAKEKAWDEFKAFCSIIDRQVAVPDFVEAEDRFVEIEAPEVLEMCEKLKRDGVIYLDGRAIVADSPLALAQKSAQICAGVVLDDEGFAVRVNTVKADWVRDTFNDEVLAILTQYRAEVDSYGGTDDQEAFRAGAPRFVGNVQRFARGIDLSCADAMVMTGCPWSAEAFIQGRDRLLRRDRERSAPVYFPVIKGGIDAKIFKKVAIEKKDFTARQYL